MEKIGGIMLFRNPTKQQAITDIAMRTYAQSRISRDLEQIAKKKQSGKVEEKRDDAKGIYGQEVSWETKISIPLPRRKKKPKKEKVLWHRKKTIEVMVNGNNPEPQLIIQGRREEYVGWDRREIQKALRRALMRPKSEMVLPTKASEILEQQKEHHRLINNYLQLPFVTLGVLAAGSFGLSMAHLMSDHSWFLTKLPVLKALHISAHTALIWEPAGEGVLSLLAFAALKKTNTDLEKYDAYIRRSLITN